MTAAAKAKPASRLLLGLDPECLSAPFGLKLGETSISDLEEEFVVTSEQGKGFTGGPVIQVIPRYEERPDIECIVLAFDKAKKLDAAWFTLNSDQYEDAFAQLHQRFELINTNDPIKGSRSGLFIFEACQISLHAPLFSKEMTLGYRTRKFSQARMNTVSEAYE